MQEEFKNSFDADDDFLTVEQLDGLLHQIVQVAKLAEQTESMTDKACESRIGGLVDSFIGGLK